MRILIISDAWTPQVNGVVRTYEDLNQYLENAGHVARVIGPADFPHRRPLPGYPEIELVLNPGKALRQMIDAFQPDSIHIATEGPLGWAGRRVCLKRKWPFTTAFHTHFPDYAALRAAKYLPWAYRPVRALGIKLVNHFHRPSAAVMTTTKSVEAELKSWAMPAPLHRLTRGTNTSVFHPGARNLFPDLPRPIALYVGRVAIEKNIRAFLDMPWAGSKVVVGGGPNFTEFSTAYPDVHFAGMRRGNDLADHYRAADVFVFPSRTETFGIVLIEAMACGLPIAGYNVTGPRDVVTTSVLGCIDDNLETAAHTALIGPGTAQERFEHLQRNFTWDVAAAQFIAGQAKAMIKKGYYAT